MTPEDAYEVVERFIDDRRNQHAFPYYWPRTARCDRCAQPRDSKSRCVDIRADAALEALDELGGTLDSVQEALRQLELKETTDDR